jgi:hypothetical protein
MPGTNPFAADEPTETALVEPAGITTRTVTPPGRTPSQLKATQPMRIVDDDDDGNVATADTLPPPEPPRLDPPPEVPPRPAADAAPEAGAAPETTPDEAARAKAGGDRDAKLHKATDAGPGEPSPAKHPAKPDDISDDKPDETVEVDPVASGDHPADAKPPGDHEHVPPIADGAKPVDPDAAPAELATADTGRVRVSGKDKDAG